VDSACFVVALLEKISERTRAAAPAATGEPPALAAYEPVYDLASIQGELGET
jgi:hypothetical protein